MLKIKDQDNQLQQLSSQKTSQIRGSSDFIYILKSWFGVEENSFYGGGSFGGGGVSGSW
jgi:hypothetical protein